MLLKIKKILSSARQQLKPLIAAIILNGCAPTAAKIKIASVDSFCEGKFESQWLERKDYDNIDEMRKNEIWRATIDKIIDNKTLNEKEYEYCKKE